jgi:hypothetical protein
MDSTLIAAVVFASLFATVFFFVSRSSGSRGRTQVVTQPANKKTPLAAPADNGQPANLSPAKQSKVQPSPTDTTAARPASSTSPVVLVLAERKDEAQLALEHAVRQAAEDMRAAADKRQHEQALAQQTRQQARREVGLLRPLLYDSID